VPALVGLLDDRHVGVLLSQPRPERVEPVLRRLSADVHALSGRRADLTLVLGAGTTFDGAARAAATLREAVRVSDTAARLPPRATWFRPADLRLTGLVHQLRDSPHLPDYVQRELGPVLADPVQYAVLAAFCRAGGNKTAAAAALFVSRASLYDRLRRLQDALGVDLDDPEVVLGLHFAVLVHESLGRPERAVRPGS
jgi:purine catabolism regulator